MKRPFLYIAMLIFSGGLLGAGLTGCGESLFKGLADDDTKAAKVEQAKIDIDDGDYAGAISLLLPLLDTDGDGTMDNNADGVIDIDDLNGFTAEEIDLATDLATAYMGKSGVDLIEFLNSAANIAQLSLKDRIQFAAIQSVRKGVDFWVSPAYAATDCLNDPDFKVVSDALPTLDADNMDDLELGIALLDALKTYIATNLDLNVNSADQKNLELLRATGYFTRLVMDIILATDTNANNIPDDITVTTISAGIATRVDDGFDIALQAILDSGILGTVNGADVTDFDENELSKAVNDVKNDIDTVVLNSVTIGNGDGTINQAELVAYLTNLVSDCAGEP